MKKINTISLCLLVSMFALFIAPFAETVNAATTGEVAVTATVGESISLAVNNSAISFGALVSSGPRFANTAGGSNTDVVAHTITVSTSAASGYSVAATGATLATSTFSITPMATAATSTPGTEQFGIRLTDDGGAGTTNAEYSSVDFSMATSTAVAASTSASADVYSVHYLANISITTETGAYATALTYTVTSSF